MNEGGESDEGGLCKDSERREGHFFCLVFDCCLTQEDWLYSASVVKVTVALAKLQEKIFAIIIPTYHIRHQFEKLSLSLLFYSILRSCINEAYMRDSGRGKLEPLRA